MAWLHGDEMKTAWPSVGRLGLKKENFPKVVRPLSVVGRITRKAAEVSGLRAGTAVICGTTDTAAEIFAAGAAEKGAATLKLATAGRICVVTDRLIPDKHLINYSHVADGLFYPGTATKSCASSLRWFRDAFGGEYKDLDALAETVPVGSDGMFFHPFLSGELTPYGDPELKASFTGVTFTHTKAHFVRAVLEGVAFSLLDCKKYLEEKDVKITRATAIGGGATSGLWKQIVAEHPDGLKECWNCGDYSHAWGGTPAYQMVRSVMGIVPLAPGWKKIRILPRIVTNILPAMSFSFRQRLAG